jgi:hypothetical protein
MKTTVTHVKEPHDIYVGRPSKYGNPFVKGVDGNRTEVIAKHRAWVHTQPELIAAIKAELKGKVIACWCHPKSCHADVLAEIANDDDLFS